MYLQENRKIMKTAAIIMVIMTGILISCNREAPRKENSMPEWFTSGKFGMFIHWGPYSVLGGEWKGKRIEQGDIAEWIMKRFEIPVEDYKKVAATFNPFSFNADEWVSLAKKPG